MERHASPRQTIDRWTAYCRCHGRKQMDVENECGNCSGGTCMCQTPENCELSASPAVLLLSRKHDMACAYFICPAAFKLSNVTVSFMGFLDEVDSSHYRLILPISCLAGY